MTNLNTCLADEQLQAVADHEADSDSKAAAHVAQCPTCRARVEEIRRDIQTFRSLHDQMPRPTPAFERRVRQAMQASGAGAGATTVRTRPRSPIVSGGGWGRRVWTSGLVAAALVILAVFVIWPSITRESRLSAAEILGRSLQTFSVARGVETLVYEVQLDGLGARALVPNYRDQHENGRMLIQQIIDHDHAGRYIVKCFDANHSLKSTVAQDSAEGVRMGRFQIDDKWYYFKFVASPEQTQTQPLIALPDLQRAHLRALVSVMQSTADQKLTTTQDATGTYYSIQIPPVTQAQAQTQPDDQTAMFDLSDARALIHAGDFHLKELAATGTFLGRPFHLAFTLAQHDIVTDPLDASAFAIQPQPGDIVLEGEATNDVAGDVVLAALRALGKAQP